MTNWTGIKWLCFGMALTERYFGMAITFLLCGLVAMIYERAKQEER